MSTTMNVYRIVGDQLHLLAIVLLIWQLIKEKNARGISLKTQQLRLMVFCTRFLDLFIVFYSWYRYSSIMKIVYIVSTLGIIVLIKYTEPYKTLYNYEQDSFPIWRAIVLPCSLLAIAIHLMGSGVQNFYFLELLWAFSIWLESVAILPQLMVLRKYRLVENLTGKYVLCLGLYRLFYIFSWIYRSHHEKHYQHHWGVYIAGVIQTLLYADFFYQYCCILCIGRSSRYNEDGDNRLIFESEREMVSTRKNADTTSITQSLLNTNTNTNHNLTDESVAFTDKEANYPKSR